MVLRRLLIVLAAYGLSAGGFLLMLTGALSALAYGPNSSRLVPLLWLFAWYCHGRMSLAWIRDRTLSRRWPLLGTIAGVVSLFSISLVGLGDPETPTLPLADHFVMPIFMGVFFLPCILLAIHLVRHHWAAADPAGR